MFDPWGAVTVVQDGAGTNLTHLTFFDRGYTGHEHLQSVGLFNMNARLYNPALHRFLEADNFVQDPYNTQNYNRYGYCVNNPLKYTDVTGNIFNIATTLGCIPVVGSIFSSLLMHQTIDWGRVAEDAVITGISIGVTFGIGQACATITNFYSRMAVSALAHGVFQGGMAAASGGKFWAGFAAGAVSSIAASLWQGGTDNIENPETGQMESVAGTGMKGIGAGAGAVGTIAFGTIMGGAASSLAGGNFWQGAVSGMIVSTFNHYLHDEENKSGQKDPPNKYKKWFSQRLREFNESKAGLRKIFNFAETAGGTAVIVGAIGAPFTDGATLAISVEGEYWSAAGTIGNIGLDLTERNFDSAFYRLVKFSAFLGTSSAIQNLSNSKYLMSFLKAINSYTDAYVMPALEDSWNKFNPPPQNKLKN